MPRIIYICFYEYFDHENYENRNFTKYPDINSNFFNYPKVYEPYFNDYLPFRNELVQLNGIIDYYIFRDVNYTSLTFYGKEYNQFWKYEIKNYAGEIHVTDLELEQMKNNLINFRDELSKNNIDVIFMICPNKSSVYNEYVPYYVNKVRVNSTDIIMQYITNNTDINIFYAKDELIKYKDKYQLYYKYDSHWNNLGGYVGFMNLIKKLNGSYNVIDIDNTTITEYTNIRYIDRNKYLEKPDTYFYISNFTTNEFHFLSSNGGGYGLYAYTESDSENNEEVLFLRDSFGYYMFDYMASYFKRLTFLHIYNFNYKHLIDKKPSIIVYEVAEHDLKNVFLNLIPKYEIEKINTLEN